MHNRKEHWWPAKRQRASCSSCSLLWAPATPFLKDINKTVNISIQDSNYQHTRNVKNITWWSLNNRDSPYFCILSFNMIISSSTALLSVSTWKVLHYCFRYSHFQWQLSSLLYLTNDYLSSSESFSFLCLNSALSRLFLQRNLLSSMLSIWK